MTVPTEKRGWRTDKVYRPRHEVLPFVAWLKSDLVDWPEDRWLIGGSWRRGASKIGDLDVMVVTESGTFEDFPFPKNFRVDQRGPQKVMGSLFLDRKGAREELHADFWACKPSAYGAMALFITGPKAFNIEMRRLVAAFGWTLNEKGLFAEDGTQLDDGTEEDILKKVYPYQSEKWLTPEQRQEYATYKPPDTARVRTWNMQSDSGNGTYLVTCKGEGRQSSWDCKCMAFKYSREIPASCKHIKRKKKALQEQGEDFG